MPIERKNVLASTMKQLKVQERIIFMKASNHKIWLVETNFFYLNDYINQQKNNRKTSSLPKKPTVFKY